MIPNPQPTTRTNSPQDKRVRVLVSLSDSDTPRRFELVTDAEPEDLQRAIDAGAAWFGVAFAETLRRARQQRAEAEVERAA